MSESWVSDEIPVTTTSLKVAEVFGKTHKYVLERIESARKLLDSIDESRWFIKTTYTDKRQRPQKMYEMTRDGFTLIAMGFTGPDAFKWKVKYLKAFNSMEKKLIELKEYTLPAKEYKKWLEEVLDEPWKDDGRPLRELPNEDIPPQLKPPTDGN